MTTNTATAALPILATHYGNKVGVSVTIGGRTAYTNGKTINVPALKPDAVADYKDVLFGYIAHEGAHVRHTDFDLLVSTLQALPKSVVAFVQGMTNVLEDARIEREFINKWVGTQFTLNAICRHILLNDGYPSLPEIHNTADRVIYYALYKLQSEMVNQHKILGHLLNDADVSVLESELGTSLFKQVNALLDKNHNATSTKDVLDIACEIKDLLLDDVSDADSEDDQGDQSGSSDDSDDSEGDQGNQSVSSDSSDDSGSDQGDQSGSSDDSDESEGDQGNQSVSSDSSDDSEGDQGDQSGSSDGSLGDQSGSSSGADDSEDSLGNSTESDNDQTEQPQQSNQGLRAGHKSIKVDLEACEFEEPREKVVVQQMLQSDEFRDDSNLANVARSFTGKTWEREKNQASALNNVNDVRAQSSVITAHLRRFFEAITRSKKSFASAGRKVANRKLAGLAVNNTAVFKRKTNKLNLSAEICFLVDASGSMERSNRARIAMQSTLSLIDALSVQKGIKTSVFGFGEDDHSGTTIQLIKKPEESVYDCAARSRGLLANIAKGGHTPTEHALLQAGYQLLESKAKRKIAFLITDGAPSHHHATVEAYQALKRQGVEVLALGIQETGAIGTFSDRHAVIHNLATLKDALFALASESLEQALVA